MAEHPLQSLEPLLPEHIRTHLARGVDDFFPPNVFSPYPGLNALKSRWSSAHLLTMHERPLFPPDVAGGETYRLLYLPTFHKPVVVRVYEVGGAWRVVCKTSSGQGGFDPGHLASERERRLSRAQVRRFARLVSNAKLWEMASSEESGGLDGETIVLEAVRCGQYHLVDRWSPSRFSAFGQLVEFFLALSRSRWSLGWIFSRRS